MEELFLVIITNRSSNIVEDLETIRLLSKLVPDICGGVAEENIQQHAFELLFAFDEAISQGGLRESLSLSQIKTNLEMDSHEEKLQNMIQASRVEAARDEADRMARTISDRKREESRLGQSLGKMVGIEGGSGSGSSRQESEISPYGRSTGGGMEGMGSTGSNTGSSNTSSNSNSSATGTGYINPTTSSSSSSRRPKTSTGMKLGSSSSSSSGGGMKLGSGKGSLLSSLAQEEKLAPMSFAPQDRSSDAPLDPQAAQQQQQEEQQQLFEGNRVELLETVSFSFSRDGEAVSFDLRGDLTVTISAEDAGLAPHVQLAVDEEAVVEKEVAFQSNPKVSKDSWDAERCLVLKNAKKGFLPNKPLKALRWRSSSVEALASLFAFSCWVEEDSEEDGAFLLTVDWSVEEDAQSLGTLRTLAVSLPTPPNSHHDVVACERGEVLQNSPLPSPAAHSDTGVTWRCVNVSAGDAETLELRVRNGGYDENALFPLQVTFSSSEGLIAPLRVVSCTSHADGAPLELATEMHVASDVVTIV